MNTPNPSTLKKSGTSENALRVVKTVSDAQSIAAVKAISSLKLILPVRAVPANRRKPHRSPRLKSIVLFEKVHSFRRMKGDLPGAPANIGI